jgi:nitrogen fixation NifU-like protein
MSTRKPYNDVIMDHIRSVRNYRVMNDATHRAEAVNPLCGDTFTVYVKLHGELIDDLSFQCECCGISMASASVMSEWMRGRSRAEALAAKQEYVNAVRARDESLGPNAHADAQALLQQVHATPARDGCAMLAWTALETALNAGVIPGKL